MDMFVYDHHMYDNLWLPIATQSIFKILQKKRLEMAVRRAHGYESLITLGTVEGTVGPAGPGQ